MPESILTDLKRRHCMNEIGGVCAICSVHPGVLSTAMKAAREHKRSLLVEVTPNQVNLDGGYSGLTPSGFSAHLRQMARQHQLLKDQLIIGADHLGPHLWKSLPAHLAMQHSLELVTACVTAGYGKIHLDTAVSCADDDGPQLTPEVVAARAALLCAAAEAAAGGRPISAKPVYVIGNEVPTPGGSPDECRAIRVTDPEVLAPVLELYHRHFLHAGLERAWQRVIAVVVQPGIEFGDRRIAVYQKSKATSLSAYHDCLPANMTYEVHSADYQPAQSLRHLVQDHFVIFKIGPALTHALHRVLFALADIESDWSAIRQKSDLRQVMARLMDRRPDHWLSHYRGSPEEQKRLREESLRDRIRYYWNDPEAVIAVERLMSNLDRRLPEELVQRHLPDLNTAPLDQPDNQLTFAGARALVHSYLQQNLRPYVDACRPAP